MDQVQLCLVVVLTFTCLVQMVTPIPFVIDEVVDDDTGLTLTDGVFGLKDKTDMHDPSTILLNRFRRNTAQWLQGSQHFNDYNNQAAAARRFAHRRNNRYNGGGQILDA